MYAHAVPIPFLHSFIYMVIHLGHSLTMRFRHPRTALGV